MPCGPPPQKISEKLAGRYLSKNRGAPLNGINASFLSSTPANFGPIQLEEAAKGQSMGHPPLQSSISGLALLMALLHPGQAAFAQLDSGTSTFSTNVAAHCNFVDFPTSVEYEFTGTRLQAQAYFGIISNTSVSISLSPMTMIREPSIPGYSHQEGTHLFFVHNNASVVPGNTSRNSQPKTAAINNTPNVETRIRLFTWVNFIGVGGTIPGEYEYSMTFSCLQG